MSYGTHLPLLQSSVIKTITHYYLSKNDSKYKTFQIFLSSPKIIAKHNIKDDIDTLRNIIRDKGLKVYVHSSYMLNFSDDKSINYQVLENELEFAKETNMQGCIIHMGKFKGSSKEVGITNFIKNIKKITNKYDNLILETPAGQGTEIGITIDDMGKIHHGIDDTISSLEERKNNLKWCIDTCHIFSLGYDISTKEGMISFFIDFDQIIGIQNIKVIHLNDSQNHVGARVDRHEIVGEGFIFNKNNSLEVLKEIVDYFGIDVIFEVTEEYEKQRKRFCKYSSSSPITSEEDEYKEWIEYIFKERVSHYFKKISEFYGMLNSEGNQFKKRAYDNILELIKYDNITFYDGSWRDVKGVGKGIEADITEILSMNTCERYEKLKNDENLGKILNLVGVPFIGVKKAIKLVSLGIDSIDKLKQYKNKDEILTKSQILSLQYYEYLVKRIKHSDIEIFDKVIKSYKKNKCEILGSYRRDMPDSGDIDLLMVVKKDGEVEVNSFLDWLGENIDILGFTTKRSFIIMFNNNLKEKIICKVDIHTCSVEEYPFHKLYFTGSKRFNQIMRGIAVKHGMKLNEYGLFKGEKMVEGIKTEKDIFKVLEMKYKEPERRSL